MKAIVLRHHREDDPGLVGLELERRGYEISVHHVLRDGPLPDPSNFDLAVVLGSKWSVYDRATIGEWIDTELNWLRQADRAGIAVLGICFGAQSLCVAHGGVVEASGTMEIGWYDITPTTTGIPEAAWFQYHGDRCLPSDDMDVLATNELCVQAFRIRKNLATQFHPEIERGQLERWLTHGGEEEMRSLGFDVEATLEETDRCYDAAVANVSKLIDYFLTEVAER